MAQAAWAAYKPNERIRREAHNKKLLLEIPLEESSARMRRFKANPIALSATD
jgi:hypothetical protein